jgi:hypothetical protein
MEPGSACKKSAPVLNQICCGGGKFFTKRESFAKYFCKIHMFAPSLAYWIRQAGNSVCCSPSYFAQKFAEHNDCSLFPDRLIFFLQVYDSQAIAKSISSAIYLSNFVAKIIKQEVNDVQIVLI